MRRFLLNTCLAIGAVTCTPAFSQQPELGIRLKIDANVDGEHITIDTMISSLEDLNMDQFMRELGLEEELGQINIDIRSDYNGYFWDQERLDEMMENLQDLEFEMPEMPEMPDLGNLVPLDMTELQFGMPNKAVMGVYTDKDPLGARITSLTENGAAKAAGLQEGDIILSIDKRTIESPSNLSEVIGMYAPGDEVTVLYMRAGKEEKTQLTLQENSAWQNMPERFEFNFNDSMFSNGEPFIFERNMETRGFLGVYLEDGDKEVIVTGVEEGSAAEEAGLTSGDVIISINDTKVSSYDELVDIMDKTKPGDKVEITYERDGKRKTTTATLKEKPGGMYFFKFDDEGNNEEGYYMPDINIFPTAPCPPGSSYNYVTSDSSKRVCITICTQPKAGESIELKHPLMDPSSVSVYSNPTNGAFNVRFTLPDEGDTRIIITDVQGKEVYTEQLKNFSGTYDRTINLKDVAQGTYFVKVMQNGFSATQTVVVQ